MKILIEGAGNAAWGTLLPFLRPVATALIGVDASPLAFGLYAMDRGYVLPPPADPEYVPSAIDICRRHAIDVVFATQGPALLEWSRRQAELAESAIRVVVSPAETIAICQDKWETYRFFIDHAIPTPATSLAREHSVIKPRVGEGGNGTFLAAPGDPVDMTGRISQQLLEGQEISIDALCALDGSIIHVVARERIQVESGLAVIAKVIDDPAIIRDAKRILEATPFVGPVNIQCFRTADGIFFTEINPRISGGLSLSMAATENWFELIARMLRGLPIAPKPVRHGLMSIRHLADCFVHESDLAADPPRTPAEESRA